MFGAVVVGVGTVGRVRIRDVLAPLPGSTVDTLCVKGFISRRSMEPQQGVEQMPLEEALSREDIRAAFICTENTSHEDNVRTFLQAGKHVCVEYPMAMNYKAAVELFDLAQEKGLVLHVEHIGLLSADYKQLKMELTGKQLQEGTLHFTGGPVNAGFGFMAFSGIARLDWLVDLFGELSVTGATMEERPDDRYMKMTAVLQTLDNRRLTWIEERGPGLPRCKNIDFHMDSGVVSQMPAVARGAVGLFMQDLELFSGKLLGLTSPEDLHKERWRILHCLCLAENIQRHCQQ